MSLRLEMLQVSRLAPRLLGDSADLVRDFVAGRLDDSGGFCDREGRPDLYYTVFGLGCLEALQMDVPRDRIAPYLEGFGDGDGLDLVHLTCLARAWTALAGGPSGLPAGPRAALLRRLAKFRAPGGGYRDGGRGPEVRDRAGTVTASFLAWGARQDLGTEPRAEEVEPFLRARRADDGGYVNEPPAVGGTTPATTAAVALLAHLGREAPDGAVAWLESRHCVHGGFTAAPGLDMPDLLSTAVVLHALASVQRPLDRFAEPCLDFIDTLWTNQGAFHGHWADDELDCEYTFYGLLALGHLSVVTA